jgi:hypothetical protein
MIAVKRVDCVVVKFGIARSSWPWEAQIVPNLADFQKEIIVPGSFVGPDVNAPVLRNAAGQTVHALRRRVEDIHADPIAPGTVFSVSVPPPPGGPPALASTVFVSTRDPQDDVETGGKKVGFGVPAAPPAKNSLFLPFEANMISYALLPAAAGSDIDFFYTAPLSGCSVFIDRIPATGDLVVYHANRLALTVRADPAAYLAATPLAGQYPEARDQMRADHTALQALIPGGPVPVAQLERAAYLAPVETEKNRKLAQGRTEITAVSGTHVMGFRIGGAWQFWWQTWARLSYTRPALAPKAVTSGRRHDPAAGGKLLSAQLLV